MWIDNTVPPTKLGREYLYDSQNELVLVKATPPSTSTVATLAYDPLMRLYQTTGGATTTRLQYDGVDLVGEYDASNTLQRRYVHGPGLDEPLVWYEGTGTSNRKFLHADERGSVVALTDRAAAR